METNEFKFKGFKTNGFLMLFFIACSVGSYHVDFLSRRLGNFCRYFYDCCMGYPHVWLYKA